MPVGTEPRRKRKRRKMRFERADDWLPADTGLGIANLFLLKGMDAAQLDTARKVAQDKRISDWPDRLRAASRFASRVAWVGSPAGQRWLRDKHPKIYAWYDFERDSLVDFDSWQTRAASLGVDEHEAARLWDAAEEAHGVQAMHLRSDLVSGSEQASRRLRNSQRFTRGLRFGTRLAGAAAKPLAVAAAAADVLLIAQHPDEKLLGAVLMIADGVLVADPDPITSAIAATLAELIAFRLENKGEDFARVSLLDTDGWTEPDVNLLALFR